jgi:DNA processing protein
MEGMKASESQSRQRLALLMAGGGQRCRRLVAAALAPGSLLEQLAEAGAPGALLRAARDAVVDGVPHLEERIAKAGWRWLVPADHEFPPLLLQTADPPLGLFVRGRLRTAPLVAVVGSRRATAYGRQVARLLGEELARAGVIVVSGMARGVDAAAHEGALAVPGDTWAVWGAGPDRIYPPEHAHLAEAIAGCGALLTEYPPGTPPRRHHFPERNRLLAGMVQAVVVVEAAARSGALVTARQAVDEGREVFAVPGSIFSERSVGPNALLRVGARPLLGTRDLLEAVGAPLAPESDIDAGGETAGLLEHLPSGEAVSADELAARANCEVHEVLLQVLELELAGRVERQPDGRYCRVRGSGRNRG